MKTYQLLILSLSIVVAGCGGEPKAKYEEVEATFNKSIQADLKDTSLVKYLKDGEVKIKDVDVDRSHDLLHFYSFTLEGKLNEQFESLSLGDKYAILEELNDLESFDTEECGQGSNCEAGTYILTSGTNTYEIDTSLFTVMKNGVEISAPESSTTTTTVDDSNDGSVNKQEVYSFMKAAYDELTNYGDNYVPEVHDPQVADMAAAQFGISAAEAGQIYIDGEMGNL